MSQELVFYTHPMSRGRIVRWMLEEIGQPYRTELLEFSTTAKSPEFLAINPMGKIPAITHGDTVVTEVAAICAYLADAFPQAGLAPPPTSAVRGPYYRWLFFAAGPVEAMSADRSLGVEIPEDKKGMVGYGCRDDVLNALEQAVAGRTYIAGDSFTAADVYVGSHIGWGMQFGAIDKRPAFESYLSGLMGRPAAVRAREIDDGLIAAQQKQPEPAE